MTSLFSQFVTRHCPGCRRIVVVKADAKDCPVGHPLPNPEYQPEPPERKPDVKSQ